MELARRMEICVRVTSDYPGSSGFMPLFCGVMGEKSTNFPESLLSWMAVIPDE
jgi:hypothetical protein